MSDFANFPNYQDLGDDTAHRNVPVRIREYGLLDLVDNESTVLDIGCNRGYFGVVLAPYIKSYTGIEKDFKQIRAGRNSATFPDNVTIKNVDFAKTYIEESFDLVLSLAVHSYIDIDMMNLSLIYIELLKAGGHLVLEGHPPKYRGEPEKYWNVLIAHLKLRLSVVKEYTIIDRNLKRPFIIFKKD